MTRTAKDLGMPSEMTWPPPGTYTAECVVAEKWTSPQKGTPAVRLEFATDNYQFEDLAFVGPKTVKRLNLIAQRLCWMPKDTVLPDGDSEAASVLAKYILANAVGKTASITVEENAESYMATTGPDAGQVKTRKRRRVGFSGYQSTQQFAPESANDDKCAF